MHSTIAAMEPPVVNKIQGWDRNPEAKNIYLAQNGIPMSTDHFDMETKQLLAVSPLTQYDSTARKNYLKDTDFMTLP